MVSDRGSTPNWSEIFRLRPDLESPGYQETVRQMRSNQPNYELERLREKMGRIHKEKLSAKNKNRSANKKRSVNPEGMDSLLSVNKRGRNGG